MQIVEKFSLTLSKHKAFAICYNFLKSFMWKKTRLSANYAITSLSGTQPVAWEEQVLFAKWRTELRVEMFLLLFFRLQSHSYHNYSFAFIADLVSKRWKLIAFMRFHFNSDQVDENVWVMSHLITARSLHCNSSRNQIEYSLTIVF